MTPSRFFGFLLPLAIAGGLALGLMVLPSDSYGCNDGVKHKEPTVPCGGGAGGGVSGKTTPIVWTITEGPFPSLVDDGGGSYSNNDGGVKTKVGGQTQPNAPGIYINLGGTGKDPREITVTLGGCVDLFDNCALWFPDVDEIVFNVQRAHMILAARPYEVDCPPPLVDDECPDVFTMEAGGSAQMAFQIFSHDSIYLEIASAIGGCCAPNPGRCLSALNEDDRALFLGTYCSTAANCNVEVTAMGTDSDGRNDSWDIVAAGDTGLICSLGEGVVIGVATGVSFSIEAVAE